MAYKKYEKYKDSGVEWIGEIPEHWNITRVKYICSESAIYGLNETANNYEDEGVRLIRTTDINEYGNLDDKINGVFISEEKAKGYILKTGDILVSRSGSLGLSLYFDEKKYGKCSYASYLVKFRTNRYNHPRYLFYFTKSESFYHQIQTALVSSTISNFNGQKYANMKLPLPSYHEQKAIANFLDQKTSEIDSLIADKEKMIQLLQEKRQAIISEAVTKGLDPNVRTKDSGIEWIGEVPEHWSLSKIKYVSLINNKTLSEDTDDDYEIDYIDISSVTSLGKITGIQRLNFKDAPSRARRILSKGDTIVSTVRTYLRAIAFIENTQSNLICSTGFAVLTPLSKVIPKYLFYLMNSEKYVNEIMRRSVGVSYPAVNASDIGALECVLPDKDEQKYIVEYLDNCTMQIDQLVNDIQIQIQKLKEYRQSLISEAVTGKIDVRDFNPNTEGEVSDA